MAQINYIICAYIYRSWIEEYKSQRAFALDHNIEESIVRKIKKTAKQKDKMDYNIPVKTLMKICESRDIKLSDFFKDVEAWSQSF